MRNGKVRKLTFTGSTNVGKILMAPGPDQIMKLGSGTRRQRRPLSSLTTPISTPRRRRMVASTATTGRPRLRQ